MELLPFLVPDDRPGEDGDDDKGDSESDGEEGDGEDDDDNTLQSYW